MFFLARLFQSTTHKHFLMSFGASVNQSDPDFAVIYSIRHPPGNSTRNEMKMPMQNLCLLQDDKGVRTPDNTEFVSEAFRAVLAIDMKAADRHHTLRDQALWTTA
jgi:hypothetical protein